MKMYAVGEIEMAQYCMTTYALRYFADLFSFSKIILLKTFRLKMLRRVEFGTTAVLHDLRHLGFIFRQALL